MTDNAPEKAKQPIRYKAVVSADGLAAARMDRNGNYVMYSDYAAVCAERDALKARAEAAEAELERVKKMRDQIVGDKINLRGELATMRVEVKRLRAALFECQEEIDAYIQHEYPHDHPVQERYRQRDYAANPARIALQEKPHD